MTSDKQDRNLKHTPKNIWVCVGSLGAPHGVRGDIKLRSFTEDKTSIFKFDTLYLGPNYRPIKMVKKFAQKDGFVVKIADLDVREEAATLTGSKIFVKREQLPKLEQENFYVEDLVGLDVKNTKGDVLGKLKAVHNFGAGDVLELSLDQPIAKMGREPILPFQALFVPEVNVEGGFVTIEFDLWLQSIAESADENDKNR